MSIYHIFIGIPVLLFSAIVHECAHGWAALKCGDDTAQKMGRITLNPLPHIDFFGTIIIPLFLTILRSPFLFAYAKPVPINPFNFYNYKKGIILVSLAGSLSNFMLAVLAASMLWVIRFFVPGMYYNFVWFIFYYLVQINVVLGVLNLMPIPPIDGSKILLVLLPRELSMKIERYSRFGFYLLFFLLMTGVFQRIVGGISEVIINVLLKGIIY